MKPFIRYAEMDSPLGPITILSTERGVCRIQFGDMEKNISTLKVWSKKTMLRDQMVFDEDELKPVIEQFDEYFEGEREFFDFAIHLNGTSFQRRVWKELMNISYGETKSYKEIAQAIQAPKAVRAVGGAVNRNPIPIIVPCHRVVGSNGSLVGYNGGLEKKEKLLTLENGLKKIS